MQLTIKQERKFRQKCEKVRKTLTSFGMKCTEQDSPEVLITKGYKILGKPLPQRFNLSMPACHARFDVILREIRKKKSGAKKKSTVKIDTNKFYRSFEWRKLRYEAIRLNNGCCECCGRSKQDGAVLHVDHIKPLRKYWHLRLKLENLQVLCDLCNHGKGNWDQTDWREPNLAVLMGERMK